jgi:hypothetical protein
MNTPSYDVIHEFLLLLTEETREVARRILGRVQAVQENFLQPEDSTPTQNEKLPSQNPADSITTQSRQ